MRKTNKISIAAIVILISPLFLGLVESATVYQPVLQSLEFPIDKPVLYVDPPLVNLTAGSEFTISVKIYNLTQDSIFTDPNGPAGRPQDYPLGDLWGVEFRLTWDPTILQYKSRKLMLGVPTNPGGVLNDPFSLVVNTVSPTAGIYDIAGTSTSPAEPFNNHDQSNTVFNMTFTVIKDGASTLKLTGIPPGPIKLVHYATTPYPTLLHYTRDALFITPGAPFADFNIWPSDGYGAKNKPVMFNATASFDPDATPNIAEYQWDFGDGIKLNVTSPVQNHTYTSIGKRTISLRVKDDEGVLSAVKQNTLTVVEKRNLAVDGIFLNATTLLWGDGLEVNVTAQSAVGAIENFEVAAYYNSTAITPSPTWVLIGKKALSLNETVSAGLATFSLDSSSLPEADATYYFFANITLVPHEDNITDNSWDFVGDPRTVRVSTTISHDVALSSLSAYAAYGTERFNSPFIKGENVTIAVSVKANQTADEVFDLTLRAIASNGTTVFTKEWTDETLARQTSRIYKAYSTSLAAGEVYITVNATVGDDAKPGDNNLQILVEVVNPPVLNIVASPATVYPGDTVTLDASGSQGEISRYSWSLKNPTQQSFSNLTTGTSASAQYVLGTIGTWTVQLIVLDDNGLTYNLVRLPGTDAYRETITINVVTRSGFPIEYLAVIGIIAVALIIGLVYFVRYRAKQRAEPAEPPT